jgi:hypothetical protein
MRGSSSVGHAWRGSPPHQRHLLGREAIGGVDEIGELAFEGENIGCGVARRGQGVRVFLLAGDRGRGPLVAFWQRDAGSSDEAVGVELVRAVRLVQAKLVMLPIMDRSIRSM